MNKYAIVVLDETGSMRNQVTRVVNSMNEYAEHLPADTNLTVFKFNSMHREEFYKGKAGEWKQMTENDYRPAALTPLFDAIGNAIEHASKYANPGDKVMVMVDTDGEENHSTDYNFAQVSNMIEEHKSGGWEFLFMASGISEVAAQKVEAMGRRLRMNTLSGTYGARQAMYTNAATLSVAYLAEDTDASSLEVTNKTGD